MNSRLHAANQSINSYLTHDELTRLIHEWADVHSSVLRVTSLAKSLEGRDVWLLEIGPEPDRRRPAIWIDANMHAGELLGTNVALHVALSLLELHSHPERVTGPDHEAARQQLFYIVPRVSPDGAEAVLRNGKISRSAPRDRRDASVLPHWVRSDVDGDGRIRQMRLRHPAGDFVCHPRLPHVMVRRELSDAGPFYKIFPEGLVQNFDGSSAPYPATTSDNDSDFNRRFVPSAASGDETLPDDPETRAILEFAASAPQIFFWLNLHTFGGIFIRPSFTQPDSLMNQTDLRSYDALAHLIEQTTGQATISAFQDMTPRQDRPMTGTLASWAHEERGCFSWAVELWDLFGAAELPKKKPFFRNYSAVTRDELETLVSWDARVNGGRAFTEWKPFEHPQLGSVELGGIDALRGLINPPESMIAGVAAPIERLVVVLASAMPQLEVSCDVEVISGSLYRVTLLAVNNGWLSTSGTSASRDKSWNKGLRATLSTDSGCRLVSGAASLAVEHLPGWGEEIDPDDAGPFFQRSAGLSVALATWTVAEHGELSLQFGNERLGWRCVSFSLPLLVTRFRAHLR